jgi:hypothetical protein
MEFVPRGTFHAYAALFSIGMLTNNLNLGCTSSDGAPPAPGGSRDQPIKPPQPQHID